MRLFPFDQLFIAACGRPLIPHATGTTMPLPRFDVVVIGAGVAGLAFALRLPTRFKVALLTKGELGESNTRWAQGGLSAAIGEDDSPALHEADTIAAGAGLCDPRAVRAMVERAPLALEWLLSLGTTFDRDPATGELQLGREAAHSRRRVVHAGGDATGAEIERALVAGVRQQSSVEVFAGAFAIDLIVERGRCAGVVAELANGGELVRIDAGTVAIATGGAGQLWETTSNPPAATADGLAMALRAGVAVADVEFAQFHPTVLAMRGTTPFLVSEAVRGEGAVLRGADGERFMVSAHPSAELAPRDVVARGIQRQMVNDGADHVHLDLRHLDPVAMRTRFPTIAAELRTRGLDLATDLIPVAPAAHYFMGGIAAGTDGSTSLPGLLALGEAACTGVHGANRLASNSLLEGLVFGLQAAETFADVESAVTHCVPANLTIAAAHDDFDLDRLRRLRTRVQQVMSRDVAVVRDAGGLRNAAVEIDDVLHDLEVTPGNTRAFWETSNIALAARSVISAATLREESRGGHFRSDFPDTDPAFAGKHIAFGGRGGTGWRLTTLEDARSH